MLILPRVSSHGWDLRALMSPAQDQTDSQASGEARIADGLRLADPCTRSASQALPRAPPVQIGASMNLQDAQRQTVQPVQRHQQIIPRGMAREARAMGPERRPRAEGSERNWPDEKFRRNRGKFAHRLRAKIVISARKAGLKLHPGNGHPPFSEVYARPRFYAQILGAKPVPPNRPLDPVFRRRGPRFSPALGAKRPTRRAGHGPERPRGLTSKRLRGAWPWSLASEHERATSPRTRPSANPQGSRRQLSKGAGTDDRRRRRARIRNEAAPITFKRGRCQ